MERPRTMSRIGSGWTGIAAVARGGRPGRRRRRRGGWRAWRGWQAARCGRRSLEQGSRLGSRRALEARGARSGAAEMCRGELSRPRSRGWRWRTYPFEVVYAAIEWRAARRAAPRRPKGLPLLLTPTPARAVAPSSNPPRPIQTDQEHRSPAGEAAKRARAPTPLPASAAAGTPAATMGLGDWLTRKIAANMEDSEEREARWAARLRGAHSAAQSACAAARPPAAAPRRRRRPTLGT